MSPRPVNQCVGGPISRGQRRPGGWRVGLARPLRWTAPLLAACTSARTVPATPPSPARPNVVVILADDMGYSDLGGYGGEIATPNLDRLARDGTRFVRFYNAGRCSPSRAALLTGLYPHQAGVGHLTEDSGHPAYRGHLSGRSVTLPEALRTTGYRSYAVGKWHLGDGPGQGPRDRGFDRFYGLTGGGGVYFWPPMLDRRLVLDGDTVKPPAGWYSTDAFSDQAARFVRESHDARRPFFLYLAYVAPHFPLQAPAEDVARYRGRYLRGWDALRRGRFARQLRSGLIDTNWRLSPRAPEVPAWNGVADPPAWDAKMAVYAAAVERMDQGVGRVLDTLAALGIERNTLVLFLSDNGGEAAHEERSRPGAVAGSDTSFISYDPPWANLSNVPFRRFKAWTHEGAIVTPLIARWPGVIPAGRTTGEVGHVIDLLPTILDAARVPERRPGAATLPPAGRSLWPVLRGGTRAGVDTLFWEHEGHRAVRRGPWKLVAARGGPWELYDLQRDPTELDDLAARQPARVDTLARLHAGWARRVGALSWDSVQVLRKHAARRTSAPSGTSAP